VPGRRGVVIQEFLAVAVNLPMLERRVIVADDGELARVEDLHAATPRIMAGLRARQHPNSPPPAPVNPGVGGVEPRKLKSKRSADSQEVDSRADHLRERANLVRQQERRTCVP
jgi:hypothetical protein